MSALIASRASASQWSRTLARIPGPSAPSTSATFCGPNASSSVVFGIPGKPDPPEPGLGDLVERPGQVDYPRPWHPLERAGRGLGQGPAFGRRMTVLGDDPDCSERRGRAQDGADIVRIGDLVEDQQQRFFGRIGEQVGKPDILERLDLDHHALVRRIGGNQAAEVGGFGHDHRGILRKLHEVRGFARCPGLEQAPLGIVECRGDRMAAPEARAPGIAAALVLVLARHG